MAKKLPQLLTQIENSFKNLGDASGLKLHPDTLHNLQKRNNNKWLVFAWSALVAASIFGVILLVR